MTRAKAKAPATTRPLSVAIIGAGFGGLGMAMKLRERGLDDFVVFEKGLDVGGVWRENVYPGAACDVPSHLYSYSFKPNPSWSRKFAPQAEILDYLRDCADSYDLRPQIRFGVEVLSATFDADTAQWVLELSDGGTHRADVLVPACGQLSRPAYPRIPGLEDFGGQVVHSALWQPDLATEGKDIAVIGTGASAIQLVPQLAPVASRLTLFQREAAHVLRKPDRPYTDRERTAFATVPGLLTLARWSTYWHLETRALGFTRWPQLMKLVDLNFRWHLRRQVRDRKLRATLTPRTVIGCKRILISNDYYPALTRPNVAVVSDAITHVSTDSVVTADGTSHRADLIVLGTGFTATDLLAPMRIQGLDGRDLSDAWSEGAQAHLGITVHGFPNLFLLYGPNTNLGHSSIVFMLEAQIGYVLQALDRLREAGVRWLDVRADVQQASVDTVQEHIGSTVWDRGCTSWYRTATGRNTLNWPGFTLDYWRQTRSVRPADFLLERTRDTSPHQDDIAPAGMPSAPLPLSARLPGRLPTRPHLPAPLVRLSVKALQRTVFQPSVSWSAQRNRLGLVSRATSLVRPRQARVTRTQLDGIPVVRVFAPGAHSGSPTLVHVHGGGFCVGSPEQALSWACRMALLLEGEVLLPSYPLAPQRPFPAAAQTIDRLWAAVSEQTKSPLLLSGDSAGANLALGLTQRLTQHLTQRLNQGPNLQGGRMPAALLFISPWLDLSVDRALDHELARRDPMLTPAWLAACAEAYAGNSAGDTRDAPALTDPRLSPLHGDLGGLTPLLVQCGSDDVLISDSRAVVEGIRAAGGQAQLQIAAGRWHDHCLQVGLLASAEDAAEQAAAFLREV